MVSRISSDIISEIIHASNIVDIISESVLLKEVGYNFMGLCPFHTEKTPSFTVSPSKQIYHCFGCGAGGNVLSFLMKNEGLSFPESISILAKHYGINIPRKSIGEQKENSINRETISSINYDTLMFFHRNLMELRNQHPVRYYLKQRGITEETIKAFKLGYAEEEWHALEKHLTKKKWQKKIIQTAGLIIIKKIIPFLMIDLGIVSYFQYLII